MYIIINIIIINIIIIIALFSWCLWFNACVS